MTPKQIVLEQYPNAQCVKLKYGGWGIITEMQGVEVLIGEGLTSARAWDNAAKEINEFLNYVNHGIQ